MTLSSHDVEVSDDVTSRSRWVRKLVDLDSIQVEGNQLMAMFSDRRGYQAMAFDFTVSDSDDARAAAAQIHRVYEARMAGLGRPALATIWS